jgi:hypothetical protein
VAQKTKKYRYLKECGIWLKNITKEGLNKLLLARDNKGRTVFHVTVKKYELEVFE